MSIRPYNVLSSLIITVLIVAQTGCDGRRQPGVYVDSSNRRLIREMEPGDVIFKANGQKVLKSDYNLFQRLNEKIFRIAHKYPLSGRCEGSENFTRSSERVLPGLLLKMELTRQAVRKHGIELDEKSRESAWNGFANKIGRSGRSMEDVIQETGLPVGVMLSEMVNTELYTSKLIALPEFGFDIGVTEAEVDERIKYCEDFSRRAEENNEKARKVLRDARARILGGGKFAAVAKEVSEVRPEDGKEWQTLQLGELPDGPHGEVNRFRKWLETAKAGDISDPLDMDDGISIVGVVAIFESEGPKKGQKLVNYKLVRCTRYFREKAIKQTRAETRKLLKKEKEQEATRLLGEKLFNSAVIEFPHGTNFYSTVEEDGLWWQEEFKRRKF